MLRCLFCFLALLIASRSVALNFAQMRRSVFRIASVSQEPSEREPWKQTLPKRSHGSGFYIGQGRILTNAHVVAHAKQVSVLRDGEAEPVLAEVRFVAHDADLAILTLKEAQASYFKRTKALRIGNLPKLRQEVMTIGYPLGGDQLSITKGVVSRVSFRRYVHSGEQSHLLIQVDSAINPGNSGGPVMQGDQVVGVAFQANAAAENTGYIIPPQVIQRFLKDIEDGVYDGHLDWGFEWMPNATENAATRRYHGLLGNDRGVKISFVDPGGSSPLLSGDLLLRVDGHAIGSDGKISWLGERLEFMAYLDLKQIGDHVTLEVWREDRRLSLQMTAALTERLHRRDLQFEERPFYLMTGGLVFVPLSRNYLMSFGPRWFREAPLLLRYLFDFAVYDTKPPRREETIVMSVRLPHAINVYYDGFENSVLRSLNGLPVTSLNDLAKKLAGHLGETLTFDFQESDGPVVLPTKLLPKANQEILARYSLPAEARLP